MKVAVLGTRGFPGVAGGIERHCEGLYPTVVGLGFQVDVFARQWCFPAGARPASFQGVKLVYLVAPRHARLETLGHTALGVLVSAIIRPDIVHIHGVGPAVLIPLARALGLRVVFTHHGPDYQRRQWGPLAKWILRLGERWGCKYANEVIAISGDIEKCVQAHRSTGCVRIPNGVGKPFSPTPTNYLNTIGVERGRYVLAVGRFVEDKGFHDLVEAFSMLSPPGVHLVLVGGTHHSTAYSRRLEIDAKKHGVVLTGMLTGDRLWELFSQARIFVLPSHYEGLPITLLEAMSFGLDVLVSDIKANLAVGLETKDYFPVGNVDVLARMLSAKLSDEPGRDFSQILDHKFAWDGIAAKTLDVYTAAARNPRRR